MGPTVRPTSRNRQPWIETVAPDTPCEALSPRRAHRPVPDTIAEVVMGGIDVGRWLLSGVAAAALIWILEGAASVLYMDQMQAALVAHDLEMEMTAGTWAATVAVSLIAGLTLMFIHAASRPRFGPGPATAVKAALALWFGGYVLSIVGLGMIGLYPTSMLVMWAVVGLVELILAGLLGGKIYRERAT
jgi:hypothetical protein